MVGCPTGSAATPASTTTNILIKKKRICRSSHRRPTGSCPRNENHLIQIHRRSTPPVRTTTPHRLHYLPTRASTIPMQIRTWGDIRFRRAAPTTFANRTACHPIWNHRNPLVLRRGLKIIDLRKLRFKLPPRPISNVPAMVSRGSARSKSSRCFKLYFKSHRPFLKVPSVVVAGRITRRGRIASAKMSTDPRICLPMLLLPLLHHHRTMTIKMPRSFIITRLLLLLLFPTRGINKRRGSSGCSPNYRSRRRQ
mmetsp:Transcript_30612/g.64655  ORF Transcript_30612/g.64655 Transcript_30612/m.64655 type:complete len:252 (-) Transcript_30612:1444-2199(-)